MQILMCRHGNCPTIFIQISFDADADIQLWIRTYRKATKVCMPLPTSFLLLTNCWTFETFSNSCTTELRLLSYISKQLPIFLITHKVPESNFFLFFLLFVQNKMCYFLAVCKLWHTISVFCAAITKDCTLVCILFIPSSGFWKEIIHFHYLSNWIRNKFNRLTKNKHM